MQRYEKNLEPANLRVNKSTKICKKSTRSFQNKSREEKGIKNRISSKNFHLSQTPSKHLYHNHLHCETSPKSFHQAFTKDSLNDLTKISNVPHPTQPPASSKLISFNYLFHSRMMSESLVKALWKLFYDLSLRNSMNIITLTPIVKDESFFVKFYSSAPKASALRSTSPRASQTTLTCQTNYSYLHDKL